MRRALALLALLALTLALVVATLAGATTAQSAPDGETPLVETHANAVSYLTMAPDDVQTTDHATIGMDVGLDVALDGRDLQIDHDVRSLRERFDAAESMENRTAAVDAAITAVEDRTDELDARTNGIVASNAQGAVEAETMVRERAAVSAEARRLQSAVEEVEAVASESIAYDLSAEQQDRLGAVSARLEVLQGPVSDRTARLAAGGSAQELVYAESSSTGYVFAQMNGDTYARETYLGDEYDPTVADQFGDIEDVLNRTTELYPNTSSEGVSGLGATNVYRYNAGYDDGRVTVYLDGGTTNAFREDLRLNATTIPVSDVDETANRTVALRINRTFPTGPMEITLYDPGTNETVDGTVTVDDRPVGATGPDGRIWAVEPRGDVTVEATTPDATLSLSFDDA